MNPSCTHHITSMRFLVILGQGHKSSRSEKARCGTALSKNSSTRPIFSFGMVKSCNTFAPFSLLFTLVIVGNSMRVSGADGVRATVFLIFFAFADAAKPLQLSSFFFAQESCCSCRKSATKTVLKGFEGHTVDGSEIRQAPVDMVNIPLFIGFYTSQVVIAGFLNHQVIGVFMPGWFELIRR